MTKKTTKRAKVEVSSSVEETPKFTPCRQCGNTGDCQRQARCAKGFK